MIRFGAGIMLPSFPIVSHFRHFYSLGIPLHALSERHVDWTHLNAKFFETVVLKNAIRSSLDREPLRYQFVGANPFIPMLRVHQLFIERHEIAMPHGAVIHGVEDALPTFFP